MSNDKIYGEERRHLILDWLKSSAEPITGSELAQRTNVSRQVIVQDISLLKAKEFPIIATSQGYIYIHPNPKTAEMITRIVACKHRPEDTERELTLLVDHGVTVRDVIVEHQMYGEITASLRIKSRLDVQNFIKKVQETHSSLLSELTGGIHLHTLEARNMETINQACLALDKAGILLK